MTKQIPLGRSGKFALVDDDDYELVMKLSWQIHKGYAVNKRNQTNMHRLINGTPDGFQTDHVNGDRLDNRKCNLRSCSGSQNAANVKSHADSVSKYKGVYWDKTHNRWRAEITKNKKRLRIGRFRTEEAAAIAYNEAAIKIHMNFARLNIV